MQNYGKGKEKTKANVTKGWYGASLVAINSKRGSSIIHEAEHIKNSIWRYIGYTPQEDNDEDYVDTYTKIQDMVQAEILNLVKGRIEATPEGKELLQRQLKIVKKLKGKIIQETNREMEMFRKFREFSKTHPEVTYEEFIKASM